MLGHRDNGLKWEFLLHVMQLVALWYALVRRLSDIRSFPNDILWGEMRVVSEANRARKDGADFVKLAPRRQPERPSRLFSWKASEALASLREGRISGAAVLAMANG